MTRQSSAAGDRLFESAPQNGIQRRLGMDGFRIGRCKLLILITWAPLVALTLAQSLVWGPEQIVSLLHGIETHIRYLIVAPLLVYADKQCAPALGAIVRHFVDTGIVPPHERARFENIISSTRRLLETPVAQVAVIVLAYLMAAAAVHSSMDQVPFWHQSSGSLVFSPAGWWHVLVSIPLLLILFLGWVWRLALWARLLWGVSRLDLQLIAAHADGAAGLGFLGYSLRAFASVGLAFSSAAAARSVREVSQGAELSTLHNYFSLGWLVFLAILFAAPLLAFTPILINTWRRGIFEYGALARREGKVFERKWLGPDAMIDESALELQDFSATNDLYQIVSNVYAMRFFPLSLKDILILIAAMLLPFVPILLIAIPADMILVWIKGLLL
ncbi:MAG TPA: hypothetical protein VFX02_03175 [Gammaproteobacteria bacterium]|nr:hypothetical protein [Gammaproteobacteria bacterium]